MIRLRDSVTIRTTPERLFNWLESMPQEYGSWHPDHVAYHVLSGSMHQVGSEVECKEYLHGKLHSMRFRLTKLDPARRMEYEIAALGKGAFEIIPRGEEVKFVAEVDLGSEAPIIGWLADVVLRALFGRRLEAMREHMREEGLNLKKIIESGWKPGVTPEAA
jgi:hypothetical protein